MKVIFVVAEDQGVCAALRAAVPENYLLFADAAVEGALRRMIAMPPDAIVVDDSHRLGRNAVARLCEAAPGVSIVALSARSDAETLAGFNLAGARACLVKPFSCEALRQALSRATRRAEGVVSVAAPAAPATAVPPQTAQRYQATLRWLSRVPGHHETPARIGGRLLEAAIDIFDTSRAAVVLEDGSVFRIAAENGLAPGLAESLRLEFSAGLMRWFEENRCVADRQVIADPEAARELQVLGMRLGAPLLRAGRVTGALLLGERASGYEYNADDRELLTSLVRAASTWFENAHLYQDSARQRERIDGLLGNITAGVVVIAPDKTIALINPSAERILQVPAAELVGRSAQRLGSGFADIALRVLADGQPRLRQEVRDPAINARLGLSAAPLGAQGVAVIFSRLPEETAARDEIAYSPFWEYLSSRVAQEIKNPMVAINTFAQLLPKKYDSADFRQAFGDVVQKEISRINGVVETLFDFARHPRLVLRRARLNETLQNVLRAFEDELSTRAIRLETEWDPDDPEADLDPDTFAQAVKSVVRNAIDAMPDGGALRVRTAQKNGRCSILVADTGPGIAEQDAPLIFMPFFSTKEQGMGLGLTTANRIMKQHNGELRLVPQEEGGSAFLFDVPTPPLAHAEPNP